MIEVQLPSLGTLIPSIAILFPSVATLIPSVAILIPSVEILIPSVAVESLHATSLLQRLYVGCDGGIDGDIDVFLYYAYSLIHLTL